ncbi:MAG: hypothetical protein R2940_10550 [Syntrophotaleaceae bacterium]
MLICLVSAHVVLLNEAGRARRDLPVPGDHGLVVPGPLLRLIAGEFRGIAADFLFLQGLVAYGRTLEQDLGKEEKHQAWHRVYRLMDASTDLDPYFFDPYYFANAALSRNPAMVPKINAMLEKGLHRRDWDWMLPFFLGFNHFYYLEDNAKAAEFLMIGARRPGAMPLLATLAARLTYQENRTENAIVFLRGILSRTEDEQTRELYRTRLEALEKIYYLERASAVYRQRFGRAPKDVRDLLVAEIIPSIPEDPYGGSFYLAPDGSVQSTSDLTYAKGKRKIDEDG